MQAYIGTKIIDAEPEEKDGKPGYAVFYEHGYRSWSPQGVFEAAYQPLDRMSFGHAIVMLKAGKRVARAGWNGKGMWLAYVKSWAGLVSAGVPSDYEGCAPFIAMFTADKKLVPWLASQTDVLADDWQVVG